MDPSDHPLAAEAPDRVRPTFTSEALAVVPAETARAFARDKLAVLGQSPNELVRKLVFGKGSDDWQAEAGRWLLFAEQHGFLAEVVRDWIGAANAPEDSQNTFLDRFHRSFRSRTAEVMAAYFFERTGWPLRGWNPASYRTETPPLDVDFVVGAPDGRDVLVQVKAPDVPGVIAEHREVGGNADGHVWIALTKAMRKLPRPARSPSVLVVSTNRRFPLAESPEAVEEKLVGTTLQCGDVVSVPSVYSGTFAQDGWSHVGAVVLLDNLRLLDEYRYPCTVYLNPKAEAVARCDASWFRGARVCWVEDDRIRWSPEPPEGTSLLPGTIIEHDPRARMFQPMGDDLFDDPVVGESLRALRDRDPDVLAMVSEVDRSLIWDALRQSPEVRLRRSGEMAQMIDEARRGSA